jgi:hypothetical protein
MLGSDGELLASPESVLTGAVLERKSGSRFRRDVSATQQVASQVGTKKEWKLVRSGSKSTRAALGWWWLIERWVGGRRTKSWNDMPQAI